MITRTGKDVTPMIVRQEDVARQLVAQHKNHEDSVSDGEDGGGIDTIPRRATRRRGLTSASGMETRPL